MCQEHQRAGETPPAGTAEEAPGPELWGHSGATEGIAGTPDRVTQWRVTPMQALTAMLEPLRRPSTLQGVELVVCVREGEEELRRAARTVLGDLVAPDSGTS